MSFAEAMMRKLPSAYMESDDNNDDFDLENPGTGNADEMKEEVDLGMPDTNPVYDEPATPLTAEEEIAVDDTMNAVATPLLLDAALNEEELKEFVEGVESDIAVAEGLLTERTIVKFDKNAKRAQLYEVAVAAVAREKKDPLYRKLETVYKMERILKAKLRKKYHSQATKKVKEYLARARKSKSGILAKIASKLSK